MTEMFNPTWDALADHPFPCWLREAKFGIYTHWGPYAVPGYGGRHQAVNGSWYARHMYLRDRGEYENFTKNYGEITPAFGYKDIIPHFKAERFDAEQWADLFRRSGAKFAGPVAIHHDNFAMWDSNVNPWNAAAMGPCRDITGEMANAIRAEGMKFIATFHHAFNWWFFPKHDQNDTRDPEASMLYSRRQSGDQIPDEKFHEDWLAMVMEVVNGYEPDLIWFDFGLGFLRDRYRRMMVSQYYQAAEKWGKQVAITYKKTAAGYNLPPLSAMLDFEVGKMNELTPYPWITDTTIDTGFRGGWSHISNVGFKSPERLIHNLVDRVSKNGYLLLNVGPRGDGSIPQGAQACMLEMGRWLEINGEAIYGTVPWIIAGEGPTKPNTSGDFNEGSETRFNSSDIRYTTKDDNLYAICLGRPGDQLSMKCFLDRSNNPDDVLTGSGPNRSSQLLIEQDIERISMLGHDGPLHWRLDNDGLTVDLPERVPSVYANTFKIELKSV